MTVHESHLVQESTCYTDDHIFNVRANGTDTCELFFRCEPNIDLNVILFDFVCVIVIVTNTFHLRYGTAFHRNMLKIPFEGSEWTSHLDDTRFHFHLNYNYHPSLQYLVLVCLFVVKSDDKNTKQKENFF